GRTGWAIACGVLLLIVATDVVMIVRHMPFSRSAGPRPSCPRPPRRGPSRRLRADVRARHGAPGVPGTPGRTDDGAAGRPWASGRGQRAGRVRAVGRSGPCGGGQRAVQGRPGLGSGRVRATPGSTAGGPPRGAVPRSPATRGGAGTR
ncbi:DUF6343 family protein, partial [Streptomyces fradiae]|uniref:DUF6343 family protein n=1 Tax=Streptomyces fradiae TaxID=1906 RepID=UPI0033D40846